MHTRSISDSVKINTHYGNQIIIAIVVVVVTPVMERGRVNVF
jgi:hypothetical protein